ncbi:MAG TPA: hypothetical protein VIL49_07330 [Capillimicrobium sp.]|jgi:hypothetical protein
MRRALALALLALAAAAPSAAATTPVPPCVRSGERVIARSPQVVVVSKVTPSTWTVHACLRLTGQRTPLGRLRVEPGAGATVGPFAFAGSAIAYGRTHHEKGTSWHDVVARDLRRPGRVREGYASGPVRRIAVDRQGRVVAASAIALRAVTADGERLLDAAVRGTLSDLEIVAGEARWSHAGEPRRAPLALTGGCAPPPGTVLGRQSETAVVGSRRGAAAVCAFSGGGWRTLRDPDAPQRPATGIDLAGPYAAVRRVTASGSILLRVHDAASGDALGIPVAMEKPFHQWALAADGTLVVQTDAALTAHRLDGSTAVLRDSGSFYGFLAVDDAARAVVYETVGAGSLPLPPA